jgi:rubrerythrin
MERTETRVKRNFWDKMDKFTVNESNPYKFWQAMLKDADSSSFNDWLTENTNSPSLYMPLDNLGAKIDYAISLIDKHGDYSYDRDNKQEEYRTFIRETVRNEREQRRLRGAILEDSQRRRIQCTECGTRIRDTRFKKDEKIECPECGKIND